MFYLTQKDYIKDRNKYCILAFAGVIAIFLSNVAPIILFTCGLYLVYDYFYIARNKNIFPIAIVFTTWLGIFLLYYVLFIHEHPVKDCMNQFWNNVLYTFLPLNPFTNDFYLFFVKNISAIFTFLYNFDPYIMRLIWKIFFGVFVFTGVVVIIKKRQIKIMIFVFIPLLLHLLLSAFHLYPFYSRLILYAIPGLIILFIRGFCESITFIISALKTEKIRPFAIIACQLFFVILLMMKGFPFKRYEGRDSIKFVQENIKNTDKFYMSFLYIPVFQYYTDIGIISNNMNIVNDIKHELTTEYAAFWMMMDNNDRDQIIFDKITLRDKNWIMPGYESTIPIPKQLDSLGYKKLREFHYAKTSVYLYDFGE
jgi:hypothetical protein